MTALRPCSPGAVGTCGAAGAGLPAVCSNDTGRAEGSAGKVKPSARSPEHEDTSACWVSAVVLPLGQAVHAGVRVMALPPGE